MSIAEDTGSNAQLFIVVFAGDPIDLMEYRHTLLYLAGYDATTNRGTPQSSPSESGEATSKETLQNSSATAGTIFQVSGAHGFFTYEKEPLSEDMSLTPGFQRQIPVSTLTAQQAVDFEHICEYTPVNNRERGWNCQSWVGDVLQRAVEQGVLRVPDVDKAVGALADCLLEATAGNSL
ncbi:hypothetical protein BJ508DRAFT_419512 [Ascobolus immersus RN42]|uniref:Uncharacterized protein n=1 Tax=Ascobolus immersus RN42 TaxID=1160509 RepID=A0A3N4HDH9_ASCIM|nr:hypothetical protein BJ508DRAFT_419512 [Ascobolus immersus RN42]